VRPAIDLLDAVIEQGDFAHQIVALHAKADIYQGLAVRMLASVPSLPPTAYGNVVAAHDSKVRIAAALVRPWRTQALRTHREVTQLAARSPRQVIANNPVLAYVVRDSGMYSAPGIATR
jgi:hypothetical protein